MSTTNPVRRRHKPSEAKDESEVTEVNTVVHRVDVVHHDFMDVKTWKALLTGKRAMLSVGILFGFLACTLLLTHPPPSLSLLLEEYDLPSLGAAEVEWRELFSGNSPLVPWNLGRANFDGREFVVGEELASRGLSAKYPVILIPGIISTALENWSTAGPYKQQFRKRYWGGASMVMRAIQDPEGWMAALMLDPETGLDPPGIKVRAAQGIDAAQKFIEGYWLWEKIIQNLAALNYDTNNLELAAYDWRLSYLNLELRDGYFSRLKHRIESYKIRQKKKSVLVAHSMGANVMMFFIKWVEAPGFGNGGPKWVENHIDSIVSIGGTYLGVPKALTAFLSGEMKDTVNMSPAATYVLERFFSKKDRAKLFRSWAGSASMWIKGGEAVWGNTTNAPDDTEESRHTHGHFLSFKPPPEEVPEGEKKPKSTKLTAGQATDWILEHMPSSYQRMIAANYSFGLERNENKLKANDHDFRKWTNPLEMRLPDAPSLKIYCVYGHGLDTERSYWYARGAYVHDDTQADSGGPQCSDASDCATPFSEFPTARQSWIDTEMTNETSLPKLRNGVKFGEGDGTVSLISLGSMCVEGWKRKRWNPAGVKIITHEVAHQPEAWNIRGGATSGDHIDILGSTPLNELIGKVATGVGDEIEENIVSNIREYAARIDWDGDVEAKLW